jgi:ATP-dependent Zn protease
LDAGVSPRTAARVDDETTRFVQQSLERAIALLTEYRTALDTLAQQLYDTETVSGAQIQILLQEARRGA